MDKYPPIEDEIQYSEKYLKYIDRLTRQTKNPLYKYFGTVRRRVAGIAVAAMILFSCTMTVSAIRAPVVEFFTNVYERFVEILFDEDDIAKVPDTIETIYTLRSVPEEYAFFDMNINQVASTITWVNIDEKRIIFSQYTLNGNMFFDNENSNFEIFYINDIKYVCINKMGTKKLYWNTEEYSFALSVPNVFSIEECIKLIESMIKVN